MIVFESINDIQLSAIKDILNHGLTVYTRGENTKEIFPVHFVLSNPRNRRTTLIARKWSFPLAIGEFAWHLSGSDDVDFISYYANQWKNYSDDGKRITGSCYGHKAFSQEGADSSQWTKLVELLSIDKHSRRAVLSFYDGNTGLNATSKDVSCTCTLQFLIRDDRLNAICYMRSNDVIWGLPYDIFLFTMLQELLSLKLGLQLGEYHHIAASLHVYEKHFSLAEQIIESKNDSPGEMPPMSDLNDINSFLELERRIRIGELHNLEMSNKLIGSYWNILLNELLKYKRAKLSSAF